MSNTAKKPMLTAHEKEKIRQYKHELIQAGITDPHEQARYIQQELTTERTKLQEEERRSSLMNRIFTRLKEIFRPITDKLMKKLVMRNQPDMEAQFKQMFEDAGEGHDEIQGLSAIYDQFKDQTLEGLQEDGTFLDDRPKPKKKPVFFDDEKK